FARVDAASGDRVLVSLRLAKPASVPVGGVFAEGEHLHDAYTGQRHVVRDGAVHLPAQPVVLLERAPGAR
ncbi:hypothetical protein OFC05_31120, partial [Escherichia coli]|nr:hypothetical protein [Escherichia coli]